MLLQELGAQQLVSCEEVLRGDSVVRSDAITLKRAV